MKGFRDFLMRGNLLEVAVAFIIGAAFGTVTSSFTQLVMDIIAQIVGGQPNFDAVTVAGVNVGHFITALISFVLTAAVVYFAIAETVGADPRPAEEGAARRTGSGNLGGTAGRDP